jgi:hypothetical protein
MRLHHQKLKKKLFDDICNGLSGVASRSHWFSECLKHWAAKAEKSDHTQHAACDQKNM